MKCYDFNSHLILVMFLGLTLVNGCSKSSDRNKNVEGEIPQKINPNEHLAGKLILHPHNMFSGERWDWKVLPEEEMKKVLDHPMPSLAEVEADVDQWKVIERVTGKRIVWIPELPEGQPKGPSYREVLKQYEHWKSPPTLKEYLVSRLTCASEVGFHVPIEKMIDEPYEDYINIAAITTKSIIIIAVPTK